MFRPKCANSSRQSSDFVRVIGLRVGLCDLFPLCVARGRSPRTTHEGNKSHNHELRADKWLIFTLARIPQGMQKYIDEKCLYCSFFFCNTPRWHWWDSQVSRLFNYVSFLKQHFELVVRSECQKQPKEPSSVDRFRSIRSRAVYYSN